MFESSHLIFMPAVSPRISGPSGALVAMMDIPLCVVVKYERRAAAHPGAAPASLPRPASLPQAERLAVGLALPEQRASQLVEARRTLGLTEFYIEGRKTRQRRFCGLLRRIGRKLQVPAAACARLPVDHAIPAGAERQIRVERGEPRRLARRRFDAVCRRERVAHAGLEVLVHHRVTDIVVAEADEIPELVGYHGDQVHPARLQRVVHRPAVAGGIAVDPDARAFGVAKRLAA